MKKIVAFLTIITIILAVSAPLFVYGEGTNLIVSFANEELYETNKGYINTSGSGNRANSISYDSDNLAVKAVETRWRKSTDFSMNISDIPTGMGYIKFRWKYCELSNVSDSAGVAVYITEKNGWTTEKIELGRVGDYKNDWNVTEVKSEKLTASGGAIEFTLSFVENNSNLCCPGVLIEYVAFFANEEDCAEYGSTHKLMKSFSLLGADGTFDDNHNVTVNAPGNIKSKDLENAVPQIVIADGADISPSADEAQNFNKSVVYTVTRGEETEVYTVNVVLDPSASEDYYEIRFDTQSAYDKYNIYCRDGNVDVDTNWDEETKSLHSYLFWRRNVNVEIQNLNINADKYKYAAICYRFEGTSWTKDSTTEIGANGENQTLFRNLPIKQEQWNEAVFQIDTEALSKWSGKITALSWRPYCDPAEKVAGDVYLKYMSFFETEDEANEYIKYFSYYPVETANVKNATVNFKYNFEKDNLVKTGDTVEFEVVPDSGYAILNIKADEKTVEPVNGIYSFVMPEKAVSISSVTAGEDLVNEIFGKIKNTESIDEVKNIEAEYPEFFGALENLSYYGKIKDSNDNVKSSFYNSLRDIADDINVNNLSEEINSAAWYSIMKNSDADTALNMMNEYAQKHESDKAYTTYLKCLSEQGKENFIKRVLSAGYNSYSDYMQKIHLDTVSCSLEYAVGYEKVKTVYDLNYEEIGYTETAYNALLKKTNINAAFAAVGGKGIASWSAAKENLENALKKSDSSESDIKPPKTGGGGGGGGVSIKNNTNTVPKNDVISGTGFNVGDVENGEMIFSDVNDLEWAKDSIKELYKRKIITGYDDGSFKPLNNVTREEFLKMAMTAFEIEADENGDCGFKDVIVNEWYFKYIAAAVKCGIISGIEPDLFGVGTNITREQAAVILSRIEEYKKSLQLADEEKAEENAAETVENTEYYADSDEISDYAKAAVNDFSERGIIKGFDDKTVKPKGLITRVEAAVILDRLIKAWEVK